ncbi:MAG: hypothetical protein JWM56_1275 [Candidatus Peribacteria bacterium]|nr:hypothetical protein [Candidatus Peribacteria bacterium]
MIHNRFLRRQTMFFVASLLLSLYPDAGMAQQARGLLIFRPHCENPIQTNCPAFNVLDPRTLQTPVLAVGDTLDMDIVFQNVSLDPVHEFRVWIAYDPDVLEGAGLKLNGKFPVPYPDETDFYPKDGVAKIRAGREGTSVNGANIPFARIVFTVKKAGTAGISILSLDTTGAPDTHTYVRKGTAATDNLLAAEQGSLQLRLQEGSASSVTSTSSSSSPGSGSAPAQSGSGNVSSHISSTDVSSSFSSSGIPAFPTTTPTTTLPPVAVPAPQPSPAPPSRTTFSLLQVQNLRAGTDGTTVYLTWDRLTSSELVGYNVYYGTRTGEYIQRKEVLPDAISLALRNLPAGTTYFIAIRGVNSSGEETAFSKEASLIVGDGRSSTSPLAGSVTGTRKNPVTKGNGSGAKTVPGETGAPAIILMIALCAAILSTLVFLKRFKGFTALS